MVLYALPVLHVTPDEPTHPYPRRQPPNRECAHAQPRSTLAHHRLRLAAALVAELLERHMRHISVDVSVLQRARETFLSR